jgi:hypothetical protein
MSIKNLLHIIRSTIHITRHLIHYTNNIRGINIYTDHYLVPQINHNGQYTTERKLCKDVLPLLAE